MRRRIVFSLQGKVALKLFPFARGKFVFLTHHWGPERRAVTFAASAIADCGGRLGMATSGV